MRRYGPTLLPTKPRDDSTHRPEPIRIDVAVPSAGDVDSIPVSMVPTSQSASKAHVVTLMALKVGEYTEDGRKVLDSIDGIPIYSRRRYTPEEIAAEKKGAAEPPAKPKPKKKARPETTTRSGRNSATEKPAKSKTKAPKKETKTTVKTKKKAPKKSKPAPATRPRTKSATKKATPKKAKSTNGPTVDYGLKCCCGCGTPVARRNLFARGHVSRIFKLYGSNPQHVLKIAKEVKRRTEEATKHSRKNGGKK